MAADAASEDQVRAALSDIVGAWKTGDILVNAAGGNIASSRSDNRPIFDVPAEALLLSSVPTGGRM